ncbi:hypothetical protein BU17DRAFT_63260 [Hysterangium stoloniferum]|nr:hypothetical protein BU17DRAFT_63260 [Hysterangium stoloniferum]
MERKCVEEEDEEDDDDDEVEGVGGPEQKVPVLGGPSYVGCTVAGIQCTPIGFNRTCVQCNRSKKGCALQQHHWCQWYPLREIRESLKGILDVLDVVPYHCHWSEVQWSIEESKQEPGAS